MLQQSFGYPCVEKLIGFIFMHDVLGELCILMGTLLHTNACKIHVFPMEQGEKNFFLKWVFSNKVMGSSKCFKREFYNVFESLQCKIFNN